MRKRDGERSASVNPKPGRAAVRAVDADAAAFVRARRPKPSKLAADPGVVAITRPVTYWDNLGWKDTLAKPANTDLQRRYAAKGMAGGLPLAGVTGRADVMDSIHGGGLELRMESHPLLSDAAAGQIRVERLLLDLQNRGGDVVDAIRRGQPGRIFREQ